MSMTSRKLNLAMLMAAAMGASLPLEKYSNEFKHKDTWSFNRRSRKPTYSPTPHKKHVEKRTAKRKMARKSRRN